MTDEARKEEIRLCGLPGMQAFFSEKMGESRERDHFHCLTCGANFTKHQDDCNCNDYDAERWIICPLAIDSENPERGLWGMIDWDRFFVRIRASGKMNIQCQDFVAEDYPTLALLKALAAQEGIEVESGCLCSTDKALCPLHPVT